MRMTETVADPGSEPAGRCFNLGQDGRGRSVTLLDDRCLVRLQAPERQSHGLWIPDSAKRSSDELYRGTVLATGPGARSAKSGRVTPCDVAPGDDVVFYWGAGVIDVTKWPTDEYRIIREKDIRYVVEGE